MINIDDTIAQDYLAECSEQLTSIEEDLEAIEECGDQLDLQLVDRAFRAMHWVRGGAGVVELAKIRDLAQQAEDVLALILSRELAPNPDRIRVLRDATGRLRELVENADASNQADIAKIMAALMMLDTNRRKQWPLEIEPVRPEAKRLRTLLVEDDFSSRLFMQAFLSRYGECHVAVNGREAVEAFRSALEHGQRYDLICMDIMMPEMDGREAVRQVRALEQERGILSTVGAKIIMTTAVDDLKEVAQCFHELCDSYLTKPIDLTKLLGQMKSYELVP